MEFSENRCFVLKNSAKRTAITNNSNAMSIVESQELDTQAMMSLNEQSQVTSLN